MYDVLIIGCGIVGAATAFELSKYQLNVGVLERENDIAMGTTKANSAIIHAGYDPMPGTLMAKLNVRGAARAQELCPALDVPYQRCGSLVLALSKEDIPVLENLYHRGIANGVEGLALLGRGKVKTLEPQCVRCRHRRSLCPQCCYLLSLGVLSGLGRNRRRQRGPAPFEYRCYRTDPNG